MNRLVILGNGFDLAHGLPTGYCDFISSYWENLKLISSVIKDGNIHSYIYDCDMFTIQIDFKSGIDNERRIIIIDELIGMKSYLGITKYANKYKKSYDRFDYMKDVDGSTLIFKNDFFKVVCERDSIQNWVDIENEYYRILKRCLKEEGDNSKVKKLNDEFEEVKKLLEEYLQRHVEQKYDFSKPNQAGSQLLNYFLLRPHGLDENHNYLKEFPAEDYQHLIEFDNTISDSYRNRTLNQELFDRNIIQDNLILNFNYTQTFDTYEQIMWNNQRDAYGLTRQIQIHGKLGGTDNKINFGFGDEMDDHYKHLEEKDDNEYLKNIKSFQYLQNSNYRELLNFIDGEKFQVYIMGHSCGLSDRILLNTIFEHPNCRSIKVFYHEKDGRDNYTEIVQNISRHFNKKKLMREKIVNKSLCQALPQNIRFAEK